MLVVEALQTSYGDSQVLFGMDLKVGKGEVVTLLGRNGMGKTTTIKSILGLLKPKSGRISFDGVDVTGKAPLPDRAARHRAGAGRPAGVPDPDCRGKPDRHISRALWSSARWTLPGVYKLFPRLQERRSNMGNQLSGGEQQMLAIGRALMTNPKLVILDEATEGLAPLIRQEIWACLAMLKAEGEAILVIDKNVDALAKLADHHAVIEKGRVVWAGSSPELMANPEFKDRYLHV
jgi:branched-chain amino acid transport system ATP-binding protein